MYNGITKPFDTLFHNKIEMFNEINILLCSYFLFLYTDLTDGPEQQFEVAWGHIGIISLVVIVNLSFLIYSALADAVSKCKNKLRKQKYDKAVRKMQANKYAPASKISISITGKKSKAQKEPLSTNKSKLSKKKAFSFNKKVNKPSKKLLRKLTDSNT